MATALSSFYEPLRVLIGDDDPDIPLRSDAQLAAAMRTVLDLGRVTGANGPYATAVSRTEVTPDLVPADDPLAFAQLVYYAARIFVTDSRPEVWRTRAFSQVLGDNREKVLEILLSLHELEGGGMSFSTDYE